MDTADARDTLPGLEDWGPLSPTEIGTLFRDFPLPWCIAGGWALDLFAGGQSRPHADIDVQVNWNALSILHTFLPGWLHYAADGDLKLWEGGRFPDGVHDIWCRRPGHSWEFQLMVVEVNEHEWVFRRDDRICGPRETMIDWIDGLPVLAPEIQLLYKSKLPNRPKDEQDFRQVLPCLTSEKRQWLASCLTLLYGDHPWLPPLGDTHHDWQDATGAPIPDSTDRPGRTTP